MATKKKPAKKSDAKKKPKKAAPKKAAPKKAAPKKAAPKKAAPKKAAPKKAAPKKAAPKKAAPKPKAAEKSAAVDARLWQAGDHAEEIGALDVASGAVKVCDAGTLFAPVEVEVPKGTYDVRIPRNGDGDNEAAALVAKGAKPVSWTEAGAYGVDAGMSAFFDADVFARVDKHAFPVSIYDDLICNHLDPAERQGHAGAFVPFEDAKFSACRSGYGDGVYPVFVGRDAKGKVVAVVTTFL